MWLINYQTSDGSFSETEFYPTPLHKPMEGKSRLRDEFDENRLRNISLTAHVLISLEKTATNLQGELQSFAARARQRAGTYLERNIDKIEVQNNRLPKMLKMTIKMQFIVSFMNIIFLKFNFYVSQGLIRDGDSCICPCRKGKLKSRYCIQTADGYETRRRWKGLLG